ncbi:hypothetical protein BSY15_3319 [Acidovorax sp. RAC01]|nr:hypothetical protein BSY15_3319 [Acidovorax sp. RAC01]
MTVQQKYRQYSTPPRVSAPTWLRKVWGWL